MNAKIYRHSAAGIARWSDSNVIALIKKIIIVLIVILQLHQNRIFVLTFTEHVVVVQGSVSTQTKYLSELQCNKLQ